MALFEPSTLMIELVLTKLCEIVELKGASPITTLLVAVQREGGIPVGKRYYILIRALELTLQGQRRSNVMVHLD